MATISHILVPVDLGESSERTVDYAKMLARPFRASLLLLHVVPNPYARMTSEAYVPPLQAFLDEVKSDARNQLNQLLSGSARSEFNAEAVVEVGDPLWAIVEYAKVRKSDLIVMGTHGRTGVAHLMLGSVAERVVRTAPCPVLTIR